MDSLKLALKRVENIVPKNIRWVLLNLFNNDFCAASVASPVKIGTGSGGFKEYEHTVCLSKKINGDLEIYVKDNIPTTN